MQYRSWQYSTVQYNNVQYKTIHFKTDYGSLVQHSAVQYCTEQCPLFILLNFHSHGTFFPLIFFFHFFSSVFMHYKSEVHDILVAEKSTDLDHPVKVVSDDVALIHFENINNKVISDINLMQQSVNDYDRNDMKGNDLNQSSNIYYDNISLRKNIFCLAANGNCTY